MDNSEFIDKALTRDEETIRTMFSHEAPHYDLLNHVLSLNLDRGWRRTLANKSGYQSNTENVRLLDLCCGTGDVALEFLRRKDFKGSIVGLDFAQPMLDIANSKSKDMGVADRTEFVAGNAIDTGFDDESFDFITIAFGLRNLQNLDQGLKEMFRLLKPGGKILSLEFFKPTSIISRLLSGWYIYGVVPLIGRIISGRRGAYDYLPLSREAFITADEHDRRLIHAGFTNVNHGHFLFRISTLHVAEKK